MSNFLSGNSGKDMLLSGGTIHHANKSYVRVSSESDVFDVILQPGRSLFQTLYVINEGEHSITFGPADKSNIYGDDLSVVRAMTAKLYEWNEDLGLWFDRRPISALCVE